MKPMKLVLACAFTLAAAGMVLVEPSALVSRLPAKPAIIHVGPNVLYRSKHIPGAAYAGPASKPAGLEMLKAAVAKMPRDREIVVYCGCCPWDRCPNVQPAVRLLEQMGFTRVKALHLPENFKTDWIDKNYPVE